MARQFGEALKTLRIDGEVLDWVIKALKESHGKEKQYHDQMISKLQKQYNKLQRRLDALCVDKLDDVISREFYEQKNSEWRLDQDKILRKIDKHQNANQSYLDAGCMKNRKCEKNAAS